jgi:arylsulfatase A-like enzyme
VTLTASQGKSSSPNRKSVVVNTVTRLDPKYYTISERLHDEGYATGHFGKWHLGRTPYSPLENGFDVDIPHWHGPGPAGSFVAPWSYPDFDPDTPNEHIEDRMAKEAVSFMQANRSKPFFLNYWMFSVHAPFNAKPDLIDKYRKKIGGNAEAAQRCPTYAAMIESMDDAVGTLLDEIDRLGIADNTIIVFASDNGGNMYNWVDNTVPTSNAPLRGGKASMYEGGVRGPCSIVWPNIVAANSQSDQPIQSCDFYPTILDMLNLQPQPDQSFDGISITPTLRGERQQRDEIYTYFPHSPRIPDWLPPAASVVKGDWKLIRLFNNGDAGNHRWKLYNLKQDIGERNDLANDQPEKVKELDNLIEQYLIDTDAVQPTANPNFDATKYRLEDEGVAEPHGKSKKKRKSQDKPAPPVASWMAVNDCQLALVDNALVVTSTGGDPYLSSVLDQPIAAGKLKLLITMTSTSSGDGEVFWEELNSKPRYAANRSAAFEVNHDGQSHVYEIEFTTKRKTVSIRLDPSTEHGETSISAMELQSSDGATLKKWDFAAPKD